MCQSCTATKSITAESVREPSMSSKPQSTPWEKKYTLGHLGAFATLVYATIASSSKRAYRAPYKYIQSPIDVVNGWKIHRSCSHVRTYTMISHKATGSALFYFEHAAIIYSFVKVVVQIIETTTETGAA